MNKGRDIISLATELKRQFESKRDFTAPTMMMEFNGGNLWLKDSPISNTPLNNWASRQMATFLDIPFGYYERMMQYPALLDRNVNHWLHNTNETRLVRVLDSQVRAVVSNRYRTLENYDLSMLALPIFQRHGAQIVSSEVTEKRLYIKATLPSLCAPITGTRRKGDIVEAGVMVSNSEVGAGSLRVEPFLHFLACLNGMVLPHALRKYHIGKANEVDDITEMLTDEAKEADDKAFWLKVRDILEKSFDSNVFQRNVEKVNASVNDRIDGRADLKKVMEVFSKKYVISEDITNQTFNALIQGGDLSRFGLSQAITSVAGDIADYELSTQLEKVGGQVIELPRSEWQVLATAGV